MLDQRRCLNRSSCDSSRLAHASAPCSETRGLARVDGWSRIGLGGRPARARSVSWPPRPEKRRGAAMSLLADLLEGLASGRAEVVDLTQPLSERTPIIQLPPPFA